MCPFCGTESPYQIDRSTGTVVENDLVAALRDLPDDQRGWQSKRRSGRKVPVQLAENLLLVLAVLIGVLLLIAVNEG